LRPSYFENIQKVHGGGEKKRADSARKTEAGKEISSTMDEIMGGESRRDTKTRSFHLLQRDELEGEREHLL